MAEQQQAESEDERQARELILALARHPRVRRQLKALIREVERLLDPGD